MPPYLLYCIVFFINKVAIKKKEKGKKKEKNDAMTLFNCFKYWTISDGYTFLACRYLGRLSASTRELLVDSFCRHVIIFVSYHLGTSDMSMLYSIIFIMVSAFI